MPVRWHNEVAPGQFEVAPTFSEWPSHNALLMDLMKNRREAQPESPRNHLPVSTAAASTITGHWVRIRVLTRYSQLKTEGKPVVSTFLVNVVKAVHDNADLPGYHCLGG
jgi:glutamine synthetase